MSKAFRTHFEKQIKLRNKSGHSSILNYVLENKLIQHASMYPILLEAFRDVSFNSYKYYKNNGRAQFKDLLWEPGRHVSTIEQELQFAEYWLQDSAKEINEFRHLAQKLENLTLDGELECAHQMVIDQRIKYGWTVWSVEMEFFLANRYKKPAEARQYLAGLTDGASPRVAAFLAYILKERNDETVSANAFVSRCEDIFPQLKVPKTLKTYLFYRSHGHVDNIVLDGPEILSVEIFNSVIDYYESLVDICATIAVDRNFSSVHPDIAKLVSALQRSGIIDFRLNKISFLVGGESFSGTRSFESNKKVELLLNLMLGNSDSEIESEPSTIVADTSNDIKKIHQEGTVASDSISSLFKFGINCRALPIGQALSTYALRSGANFADGRINSEWSIFATPSYRIEDILTNTQFTTADLIERYLDITMSGSGDRSIAENILSIIFKQDVVTSKHVNFKGYALIWIARKYIEEANEAGAKWAIDRLSSFGDPWKRHASKLQILFALKNEDLLQTLSFACEILLVDSTYRNEFPLGMIFCGRKWRDFKSLNLTTVGIVAYYASLVDNDSNIRYICRMACRAYVESGQRANIAEEWKTLAPSRQMELLEFIRSVWIDDNLTMAGFQSTQEVRADRIKLLQYLLQWDQSNDVAYADEIKALTFSETLWRGLRHINETRVFVNEGAIAKWAEKELFGEYTRWKALADNESLETPVIDEMLEQYLAGSDTSLAIITAYQSELTESDALLVNIADRLFRKFLFDSADGLNCYLSSRIRHGTLKGTLLGPLDSSGLVGFSKDEITNDLRVGTSNFGREQLEALVSYLERFNLRITSIIERLIKQTIQIRDGENPNGFIFPSVDVGEEGNSVLVDKKYPTFQSFIFRCFDLFWEMLENSFNALAEHFRTEVKLEIQTEFDELVANLRELGEGSSAIVTTIRTVATETQAQCDLVANWFQSDRSLDKQSFSLHEAIEIAKSSTKNIYRGFPTEMVSNKLSDEAVPLTPMGLSAITDALYVMLENAWKHSGLGSDLSALEIAADMDFGCNILTISVTHLLSDQRLAELRHGDLDRIREKYIHNSSIEMAAREGGSGFAKLSRLIQRVNRQICPDPLSIDLTSDDALIVKVSIPVYSRGEAFDAYFE